MKSEPKPNPRPHLLHDNNKRGQRKYRKMARRGLWPIQPELRYTLKEVQWQN